MMRKYQIVVLLMMSPSLSWAAESFCKKASPLKATMAIPALKPSRNHSVSPCFSSRICAVPANPIVTEKRMTLPTMMALLEPL